VATIYAVIETPAILTDAYYLFTDWANGASWVNGASGSALIHPSSAALSVRQAEFRLNGQTFSHTTTGRPQLAAAGRALLSIRGTALPYSGWYGHGANDDRFSALGSVFFKALCTAQHSDAERASWEARLMDFYGIRRA
jgi:hypothetical protein